MKDKNKKLDPQELLDSLQGKADNETVRRSLELFKKSVEVLNDMDKLVILHLKTHGCCKINTDCQQLGEQLFKLKEPVVREMCIYSPSGNLEKDFIKD
jgi:hypothetical protein